MFVYSVILLGLLINVRFCCVKWLAGKRLGNDM